jgi:DNA replication and repair protein RecF
MWLRELEADRLRNLKAVSLSLPAGLTFIVGRNGQGKSSLLEAIYLLGTGRSFRTRRQDELVSWGGGPCRIAGVVESRVGRSKLAVLMDEGSRHLVVDGSAMELGPYLGRLDLVDLTGERMKVLRGGPDERRRFLDRGVVGLRASFLDELGAYRRVLLNRNALLRQKGGGLGGKIERELNAWDERLVTAAAAVHRERRRYAVRVSALLGGIGRLLLPGESDLCLAYRPSPRETGEADPARFEEIFAARLATGRGRDLAVGHTCLGPHRDELKVELDGTDLRRFGSAGQVRAAMITLKLAKLALLKEERDEAPLFLMDDFDSDLDEARARAVADHLHNGGFQALAASSKETLIGQLGVAFTRLRMDDGAVRGEA